MMTPLFTDQIFEKGWCKAGDVMAVALPKYLWQCAEAAANFFWNELNFMTVALQWLLKMLILKK